MKEAVRPFSSKLSILKLLCAFVICIMICTSFTKAEETKETTESQIMSEIDTLYSDLLQIEESIGKSLRKIQLLKRIQTNRIVVPEMGLNPVINVDNNINQATAKSQENVDLNEFSNQNLNEETTIEPTIEEIALSNSFFEKVIVDSNNTDFVKFRFLNTPLFVDKDNDFVTKVIVAIHTDGSMGVYSTNTGKMLNQFNLNQKISEIKDSNILSSNINWENDIVEFLAETYSENLRTSILTTQGNMYIFEFKIEKMDKQAAFDRTLGKPSEMLTIALSTGFNLWQTIISSNSTLYYEEINSLLQEGLIPISLSYFGNFITGNYMIADNKGFFSIIKKDENKEREDKYGFTLFKRSYSGFGYFSKITNQYYLTIFSSFDRFNFIRSLDGQIADANCSINGTEIVGITFDKTLQGSYYIATKSGDIIVYQAKQNLCELVGKISTEIDYIYNVKALKKLILAYDDSTGEFSIFNLQKIRGLQKGAKLSEFQPLKYKPNYPLLSDDTESSTKLNASRLDLIEDPTELGYNLLIRIPGTSNKLLLFDLITQTYEETAWYNQILENKGMIFILLVVLIVAINVCRFSSRDRESPEDARQSTEFKKKISEAASIRDQKLEEISQQLLSFENATKGYSNFNENVKGTLSKDPAHKSGLKTSNNITGSKKNVRFADDDY